MSQEDSAWLEVSPEHCRRKPANPATKLRACDGSILQQPIGELPRHEWEQLGFDSLPLLSRAGDWRDGTVDVASLFLLFYLQPLELLYPLGTMICFQLLREITSASGLLGSMSYMIAGTQLTGTPWNAWRVFCFSLLCSFA